MVRSYTPGHTPCLTGYVPLLAEGNQGYQAIHRDRTAEGCFPCVYPRTYISTAC